jgi:protein tyrosine phosphatase (PTP) superfamily phosphohydrolase (DUF442 family)
MRSVILAIFLLMSGVFAIAGDEDIPNLKQPRDLIFTSGQPTEKGLKDMVSRGVRVVINLRPHAEEGARDESRELSAVNVQYQNIPVTPQTYTVEKLEEFSCAVRQNKDVLILIHCSTASRVGGMWLLYRVLIEKEDPIKALQEAREIGIKPALEPIIFDLMNTLKASETKLICEKISSEQQ